MKKFFSVFMIISLLIWSGCRKKGFLDIYNYGFFVYNCAAPYEVHFYLDLDYQPSKIEYYWDFGDGQTSEDKEPVHIYDSPGKYTVKLRIVNYKTTREIDMVVDVSDESMSPKPNFTYGSANGNLFAPAEVTFYNLTQYANDFIWSFGDGLGSMEAEPTHTYNSAGTYNVILKAFCNGDTQQVSQTINILPPPDKIIIQEVLVWLPPDYLGGHYELEYYVDNYDETPAGLDIVIADDFPIGWALDDDLFYFDGVYDSSPLYFEIWEENDLHAPVYTFGTHFSELQQDHYPDTLFWNDGDFGARVLLKYETDNSE